MSAVREWALAICMAALTAALVQGLVPGGSMERMAKFVIGAFMVCAFLVPAVRLLPQLSGMAQGYSQGAERAEENTALQGTVESQMEEAARASISGLIKAELSLMNINCKNVLVEMDRNEDNSIVISKVSVTLYAQDGAECENVRSQLEKLLGLQMEVNSDGA